MLSGNFSLDGRNQTERTLNAKLRDSSASWRLRGETGILELRNLQFDIGFVARLRTNDSPEFRQSDRVLSSC